MRDITTEEAILQLKDLIKDRESFINKENDTEDNVFRRDKQALEKVLNELESEKQYHQWDVEKLQDYHKENSELNTVCVQLECELKKKDKIIDAMARLIESHDIDDDICM